MNKVHRSALSLGALRLRLGQYDAALESILECIKLAQNKNDHDTVNDSIIWLSQISGALSKKDRER